MPAVTRQKPAQASLRIAVPTEVSVEFVQGMADRMGVSYFKYGPVAKSALVDLHACALQRWEAYLASGNTEFLMDVANFAMMEFMRPSVADARFVATDSNASPGRVLVTGHRTSVGQDSPA